MSHHPSLPGRLLYQFKSIDDTKRDYLRQWLGNQLWMSNPADFNDPLDLQLQIEDLTYRGPYEDIERLRDVVCELLKNNRRVNAWFFSANLYQCLEQWKFRNLVGDTPQLLEEIKRCIAQFGVTCFTDNATHPLMWSHYADNHKGYGVEYSVNEMEIYKTEPPVLSHAVEYVSQLPTLCLSEVLLSPHQALTRMLATKSTHWAYENEWRLISPSVQGKYMPLPNGVKLTALIAGAKTSVDDRILLQQKADEFGVPLKQIRIARGYEMLLEEC